MKKLLSLLTCFLTVCFLFPARVSADPMFFLNNEPLTIDYQLVENSSPLLPLRTLSENMGAQVSWDAAAGMVTIQKDSTIIQFQPEAKIGTLNHEDFNLPPMEVVDGRIMASLDFWKLTMSDYYNITWDPTLGVAGISYKYPTKANLSWKGGRYDGETVNGIPNGKGTMVFPNAASFSGLLHQGFPTLNGKWYTSEAALDQSFPSANSNLYKGPNGPNKIVASDGLYLCFCDPASTGSGQIYLQTVGNADKIRFSPEIASCMDLENGWLYYINNSEGGKLYRISIKDQTNERLSEIAPQEMVAVNNLVFTISKNASGDNVVNQVGANAKIFTEIFNTKEPISDLQVYGDALYFSTSKQIFRSDFNGGHLTEIAAFANPVTNMRVQGNSVYYLQQGSICRLSLTDNNWQKIIAADADKENLTGFLVDDQTIYLSSIGTGLQAKYNGIYSCLTNGTNKHLLQAGAYQLQTFVKGRLYYVEIDLGTNKAKVIKSLSVRDDQTLDIRQHLGTTDPDSQFGYPSSLYYNDPARFKTNAYLAGGDPQIKSSLEQAKIDVAKADLTITRRSTLLIIDPQYLGSTYTAGGQNEVFLKTQGVLLNNFGSNTNGTLLKTSDNGLKMLLVWDRRDEKGNPVFTAQENSDIEKRRVSDSMLSCPSGRFLFLDYNDYWQATLGLQLKSIPHLEVNMTPGHYLVGYEQWDPTLQYPLNASRRNLVMTYQSALRDDE
ncbi:MAG TPA: DUF5050 domain-containing protein [Syntrophomonadaceae bacterium]|nr:DUF5050 domain-containing protein [Syntrophomonadaceae bacterium]